MLLLLWTASAAPLLLLVFCTEALVAPAPLQARRTFLPPLSSSTLLSLSFNADEECSLDEDDVFNCLAAQGYVEDDRLTIVNKVFVAELDNLRDVFPSFEDADGKQITTNMIKYNKRLRRRRNHHFFTNGANGDTGLLDDEADLEDEESDDDNTHMANIEYNHMVSEHELVLVDHLRRPGMRAVSRAFHRGGPRQTLHFDPSTVNAAIVTCGGLCPGLNNVCRELVHALKYLYGAQNVWGVVGGFHGFLGKPGYEPILLTNEMVENIHHEGGTVLRSSRGGFDEDKILEFLKEKEIDQLYVIGGDGTHRAAYKIRQACQYHDMNVAVAGIPKTIDNDCGFIDRSFGFVSAVEAAQNSIRTAKTEAMCNVPNGIGICKLMGRSAGFLAAFAALGSGDVDAVLLPEVPIVLEGPKGILPFIRQRAKEQKYVVIVVAEGAGEELLGQSQETDAGGNKKLPPIGEFIKEQVEQYFEKNGEEASVKYVDPSYSVRSVPANAADSLYCMQLAQNAVHGAMHGYTGFSVGLVNNIIVYLPMPQLVAASPRSLNPYGRTWERVLAMTGQPNTVEPKQQGQKVEEGEFPSLPEPTVH